MRRVARTDKNHLEIINAFRRMGCVVKSTHQIGQGFPDIVVLCQGIVKLCEIKDGSLPPSGRKLTPDEEKFHAEWYGGVDIVQSVDDVEKLVNQWRRLARAFQQFYRELA